MEVSKANLGGGGSVLARTTFLHMLIRLGLLFSWAFFLFSYYHRNAFVAGLRVTVTDVSNQLLLKYNSSKR